MLYINAHTRLMNRAPIPRVKSAIMQLMMKPPMKVMKSPLNRAG